MPHAISFALEQRYPGFSASRTLVIALVFAAGLGFGFAKLLDNAEHAGLEKENRALSAQIALYEAKLKVGSPEEALRKFDQLQAMVEQLRPKAERRLNDDQKRELGIALAQLLS
jgi:hypothetical protein